MSDPSKTTRLTPHEVEIRDLQYLGAEGKMVMDSSAWWGRISMWQRQGLVALQWGDSRFSCRVRLTDKGVQYVQA